MLVEFSVENYKCFKEKTTLSMVAAPIKELSDNVIELENVKPEKLLKSCVIYGANASGKSNLFKAMGFMRRIVLISSKNTQIDDIKIEPFMLDDENLSKTSTFEATFFIDNIRYRYGFSVDKKKVHSEWLFYVLKKEKQGYS
jgi:uncharacterized protein